MGLRERLEAIRENNLEVEGRPEFGFDSPEPRTEKNRDDPPRGWPWLSLWFRPRETIRHVVLLKSEWWILALGASVGITRALNRAASRDLGDRISFEVIVAACLILGPVMQLLSIYLGGMILRFCGAMFGGKAGFAEVRAALAWGAFPQAVMLLPWILALGGLGSEMFVHTKPILSDYPFSRIGFVLFYLLDLLCIVWSLILTLSMLTAVFRMHMVRVVLACLAAGCLLIGTAVLGYVVWSDPALSSFDFGSITRAESPARRASPNPSSPSSARSAVA